MSAAPVAAQERIAVIDVVRGFALFGILVVNMLAFKSTVFATGDEATGLLDGAAAWLISFGFTLKFYVLFSFLFGYGLSVQMTRAAAKGTPFAPRYLRRLLGLLLLGLAHALLLYVGDILVTYALLGVILFLMRNARDRSLLITAAVLIGATVLVQLVSGTAFALFGDRLAAAFGAELGGDAQAVVDAYRGSPSEVIAQRVSEYPSTIGFALFGQGPTALAMFLIGLWAGRRRLFERVDDNLPLLRRVLTFGLIGVAGNLVWATIQAVNGGFTVNAAFFFGSALAFATAPFLSGLYAAGIALAYRSPAARRWLLPLAPVGRMALSNYLLQSVFGAFIFTGYGLGLFGRVGVGAALALSVVIYAVQIPLSAWWLGRFRYGPAEWLLRSFTYGRLQPLRATRMETVAV